MAFTLHTSTDNENFPDGAIWGITDKGLLVITSEGKTRTYSPNGWLYLEHDVSDPGVTL